MKSELIFHDSSHDPDEKTVREIRERHEMRKHREKLLRIATKGFVCACAVGMIGFLGARHMEDSIRKTNEHEAKLKLEEMDEKAFNDDFKEVVKLKVQRDLAIYATLADSNRKFLSTIQNICNRRMNKSEFQKELEDQMIEKLKLSILMCKMTEDRIRFEFETGKMSARWLDFDVFSPVCGCRNGFE